jgi:hypothetical protein
MLMDSILKELLQLKELSLCACGQEFFIPQLGERRQFAPISGPDDARITHRRHHGSAARSARKRAIRPQ